jgi:hypothetical protein
MRTALTCIVLAAFGTLCVLSTRKGVTVLASDDLSAFRPIGSVFADPPAWAAGIWAPCVVRTGACSSNARSDAPGGAWIDRCLLSADGRWYVGRNRLGAVIRGRRASE